MDPSATFYDLLVVGFGPASLALSIALAEPTSTSTPKTYSSIGRLSECLNPSIAQDQLKESNIEVPQSPVTETGVSMKACFIETSESFNWHGGMMLEGSRMQISFLKDLATLRNPSSQYTFLNYLHSFTPSRLVSFISLGTFAPTRREYSAYMKWAARKVQLELEAAGGSFGFGERVEKVDAVVIKDSGDVEILRVTSRQLKTGKEVIRFTKNIILSTGGSPKIPEQFTGAGIEETGRLVHTSAFLYKIPTILSEIVQSRIEHPSRQIRIAVVGGGQSSAECFLHAKSYLNKLLPASLSVRPQIDLFIRKAALRPADDSPFSNEAFDPVMSQTVYDLDNRGRETFMKEIRGTNYSVANPVTLEAVYAEMYAQTVDEDTSKLEGTSSILNTDAKLTINPYSNIFHTAANSSTMPTINLSVENSLTHRTRELEYDLVILGTGYNRQGWKEILFSSTGSVEEESNIKSLLTVFESYAERAVESPLFSEATSRTSSTGSPHHRDFKSSEPTFNDLPEFTLRPSHPEHDQETQFTRGRQHSVPGAVNELNFKIKKNYRLDLPATYSTIDSLGVTSNFHPTVWLQGCNEESFGISDSLLSVLAVRSGEVMDALKKEGSF